MTSPTSEALVAEVRSLLDGTQLAGVAFVALSMTRKDGELPDPPPQFPVEVELGVQTTDEGAAYRVTLSVERPDIAVSASAVAVYHAKEPTAFEAEGVAQAFGELVALPAAYPFARAKLQEISIDTGVQQPVLLGILDITKAVIAPLMREGPPSSAAENEAAAGSD